MTNKLLAKHTFMKKFKRKQSCVGQLKLKRYLSFQITAPPHSYGLLIKVENYNIFFQNLLDSPGPLPDIGLSTS